MTLVTESLADGGLLVRVANAVPTGAASPVEGRGLTGMRERVRSLGGTVDFDHRGCDLVVEARIPGGVA